MKSGPVDMSVRAQVIDAWQAGELTWAEIAEVYKVGRATVNRLIRRYRASGTFAPKAHGGGNPRSIDSSGDKILEKLVLDRPDLTLAELATLVSLEAGKPTSASSVHRALVRLGFTRKKRLWCRPNRPRHGSKRPVPRSPSRSQRSPAAG